MLRRELFIRLAVAVIVYFQIPCGIIYAQTACPKHYLSGKAPEILNSRMTEKSREVCFSGFGIEHSGITRTALWSAEHLTRANLEKARSLEREDHFHPEENIPVSDRAELNDYSKSGWDRGHLSPSADMSTTEAQAESFSLANMHPQYPACNRGAWEGVESAVRTWAKRRGEIFVITGPVYSGESLQLLKGRVFIPSHTFKAIYDPKGNVASAYLMENDESCKLETVSIKDLSAITGIDVFPSLSEEVKGKKVELPSPTPHRRKREKRGSFSMKDIFP